MSNTNNYVNVFTLLQLEALYIYRVFAVLRVGTNNFYELKTFVYSNPFQRIESHTTYLFGDHDFVYGIRLIREV